MQVEEIVGESGFTEIVKISGAQNNEEAIKIAENWCEKNNSFFEETAREEEGTFFVSVWPDGPY